MVIESNPNISQSEIGRMLDIAGANMAPLVGRLEKRELLERRPVDGRSHGLQLTAAGRALNLRAKQTMNPTKTSCWPGFQPTPGPLS